MNANRLSSLVNVRVLLLYDCFSQVWEEVRKARPVRLFLYQDGPRMVNGKGEPIESVEIGTARECFFCNQLASAGHKVEYGGMKTGDFRIDGETVIEVGGEGKDMIQFGGADRKNGFRALDDIDSAGYKKIPLWAFGCLY